MSKSRIQYAYCFFERIKGVSSPFETLSTLLLHYISVGAKKFRGGPKGVSAKHSTPLDAARRGTMGCVRHSN